MSAPLFTAVYADCPWSYASTNPNHAVDCTRKYDVLSHQELQAIPVSDWMAKDAFCFLWATGPLLKEALEVMTAWGFSFRTIAFTWVKVQSDGLTPTFGPGFYTGSNAELVLLGRRGTPAVADKGVPQVLVTPRGAHSRKPEKIRQRIDRLCGPVPKLELFARPHPASMFPVEIDPTWTRTGLEYDGLDIRTATLEDVQNKKEATR